MLHLLSLWLSQDNDSNDSSNNSNYCYDSKDSGTNKGNVHMQVVAVTIRWWVVSTTTSCTRTRRGQRPTAVRMVASTEGRTKQDLLYAQFMHATHRPCVIFVKSIVSVLAFSVMDILRTLGTSKSSNCKDSSSLENKILKNLEKRFS